VSGALFPARPPDPRGEHTPVELHVPGGRAEQTRRWEARAAQWRAVELAEAVFGGPVEARLTGGGAAGFRGLLELGVPFEDLARHRRAEHCFLAAARQDEVLGRLPLVVVLTPRVGAP
jgi:hypothetical protein